MTDSNKVQLPPFHEVEKSILWSIIWSFLTFGIYNLFWQAHQMRIWNRLLGFEKYNFWKWFFLSLITFGIYHMYNEYVMGQDMVHIQRQLGRPAQDYIPLVSLGLAIMALPILADAIQQYELHKLYDSPGNRTTL